MTTIALLHDHYDKQHLSDVIDQMRVLGAPTIKAIWMDCYDMWAALEGCHRIRAAKALGIDPIVVPVDYDEAADLDVTDRSLGLDLDNSGTTVGELVADCHRSTLIDFDGE